MIPGRLHLPALVLLAVAVSSAIGGGSHFVLHAPGAFLAHPGEGG